MTRIKIRIYPCHSRLIKLLAEVPHAYSDKNDRERKQCQEVWIPHFQPNATKSQM